MTMTNSGDPDQSAPLGAVRSWAALFVYGFLMAWLTFVEYLSRLP